jgi:hypothetical protein
VWRRERISTSHSQFLLNSKYPSGVSIDSQDRARGGLNDQRIVGRI